MRRLLGPVACPTRTLAAHALADRDWGWRNFLSLEKYCRAPAGYAGLLDVNQPSRREDSMPSFWMAEVRHRWRSPALIYCGRDVLSPTVRAPPYRQTLKYLWLLFSDDDVLPLDRWVFNTEAHPFRIPDDGTGARSWAD